MNTVPLFETSCLGYKTKVFFDKIQLDKIITTETIPIKQVASVKVSPLWQTTVDIETTGGKKYQAIMWPKNKKIFQDFVMEVIQQAN